LPHYLRDGLRVVFIGFNPGLESARRGHYYAFGGNVFWRQLNESGLAGRTVTFEDDALLAEEAGIGFTDLCPRPTTRASELSRAEVRDGARALLTDLLTHQPRVALFSGRGVYGLFGVHALGLAARDLDARPWGLQPERLGETVPWVIPSSSGLASKWHRERLALLQQLAAEFRCENA
jgi:TDG/mug DNA glycosylase family protein